MRNAVPTPKDAAGPSPPTHRASAPLGVAGLRVELASGARALVGGRGRGASGVTFQVAAGEAVGLVGDSGSGKTLTALSILGLLPPGVERTAGEIEVEKAAMIFQEPRSALNPLFSIGYQIGEVLRLRGWRGRGLRRRGLELLEDVAMPDPPSRWRAFPHELSGGQCQRAMIAMALAAEPRLLIADEPTTALDVSVQAQILKLLDELRRRQRLALLMISHDLSLIAAMCRRLLVMEKGLIVESGTVGEVFENPRAEATRRLLAAARNAGASGEGGRDRQPPLLAASGLSKSFRSRSRRGGRLQAVAGVDLELHRGESLALIGESGSGKSTLARCLAGILEADGGRLSWNGEDTRGLEGEDLRSLRRRRQLMFQDSSEALNPRRTARQVLAEAITAGHGDSAADPAAARRELLEQVGLGVEYEGRYPHQLSGGQRQRLALARALAVEPQALILDEPTSGLDASLRLQVLDLLEGLRRERGLAQLIISHDLGAARRAQRIAVMYLGAIVEEGSASAVLDNPRHPYTAGLLASRPRLGGSFEVMPGEIPNPESPPAGCVFHPRCPRASEVCRRRRPGLEALDPASTPPAPARWVACFDPLPDADLSVSDLDLDGDAG